MVNLILVLLLVCQSYGHHKGSLASPPEYRGLPSVRKLAEKAGFTSTDLLVSTEDGYLLWMHRLGNNTGPAVLIQHGIFNAADLWINRGRNEDLPFLLLDEGYDVYLGNQRGNALALNHVKYRRSDPRFWDFSFHESGYYDLPAMIDKILKLRKGRKLFYIGYSLGTTVFFVMASSRPEYNDKIEAALLLAPIAFGPPLADLPPQLVMILQIRDTIAQLGMALGMYELGPRSPVFIKQLQHICGPSSPAINICLNVFGVLFGEHRANIDKSTFGYHLSFSPAGTSLKTLIHLGQVYSTGMFKEFDYGPDENLHRYNSTEPPHYNLSKISAPVGLFWSRNDALLSKNSVKRIASALPNLLVELVIPDPEFTHADVVFGMNNKQVLLAPLIEIINKIRDQKVS